MATLCLITGIISVISFAADPHTAGHPGIYTNSLKMRLGGLVLYLCVHRLLTTPAGRPDLVNNSRNATMSSLSLRIRVCPVPPGFFSHICRSDVAFGASSNFPLALQLLPSADQAQCAGKYAIRTPRPRPRVHFHSRISRRSSCCLGTGTEAASKQTKKEACVLETRRKCAPREESECGPREHLSEHLHVRRRL